MSKSFKAKYSYFYLLSLVSLIFLTISLGLILFNIINITIIDGLTERSYDGQLKFAISALLISAPVYYFTQHFIKKGFKKAEFSKESNLRKWLLYLILFVSSIIILGLMISLFNSFLSGELTTRFVLKALSVFFLSAFVFLYYLYNLKDSKKVVIEKLFLYSSVLVIIAIFVSAFFFIESPQMARDRKYDQTLLSNIHNLEALVNEYYNSNEELPESIDDIKNFNSRVPYINVNALDKIEYIKLSATEFQICAIFKLNSNNNLNKQYQAGYDCLEGNLWLRK